MREDTLGTHMTNLKLEINVPTSIVISAMAKGLAQVVAGVWVLLDLPRMTNTTTMRRSLEANALLLKATPTGRIRIIIVMGGGGALETGSAGELQDDWHIFNIT